MEIAYFRPSCSSSVVSEFSLVGETVRWRQFMHFCGEEAAIKYVLSLLSGNGPFPAMPGSSTRMGSEPAGGSGSAGVPVRADSWRCEGPNGGRRQSPRRRRPLARLLGLLGPLMRGGGDSIREGRGGARESPPHRFRRPRRPPWPSRPAPRENPAWRRTRSPFPPPRPLPG